MPNDSLMDSINIMTYENPSPSIKLQLKRSLQKVINDLVEDKFRALALQEEVVSLREKVKQLEMENANLRKDKPSSEGEPSITDDLKRQIAELKKQNEEKDRKLAKINEMMNIYRKKIQEED
eukprot:TRINITY_DN7422_c0_g1_i3.p1 TRINITY_DN7422_c0_g1~~TRINITY_DN7422_c0_g1_i3.p1  ORF type:complete len:122 (-),score=24.50 TRINITY_DN7422_c0_g1_i3:35-400(-)